MTFNERFNKFIDFLSFSESDYKLYYSLKNRLNIAKVSPHSDQLPASHPGGFIRHFRKRRLSLMDQYLTILKNLESNSAQERLVALQGMAEQIRYNHNLSMPLNTARVQLSLIKQFVLNQDNQRRQMEILRDFTLSSFGRRTVIRRYLNELKLIEVPEENKSLRDLNLGFDSHVHDSASSGQKNGSQLVIDAFIKGMSQLTMITNTLSNQDAFFEVIEAGFILGIKIDLGLQFVVREDGNEATYIATLPNFIRGGDFKKFYARQSLHLQKFAQALDDNQNRALVSLRQNIDRFNRSFLSNLNDGFGHLDNFYRLQPLNLDELLTMGTRSGLSRLHLGDLLYRNYKKVLFNRLMLYRGRLGSTRYQLEQGLISVWDLKATERKYNEILYQYDNLSSEELRKEYFSGPLMADSASGIRSLRDVSFLIHQLGGKIRLLHPLNLGQKSAVSLIQKQASLIDEVEIYNLYDSYNRPADELISFARFIEQHNQQQQKKKDQSKLLTPVCGSDATGRVEAIPGMGFIRQSALGRQNKNFTKGRLHLPVYIGNLLNPPGDQDLIYSLANPVTIKEPVAEEVKAIGFKRALYYINPQIKNTLLIFLGFLPAYKVLGLTFALFWLGITAVRNILSDLLAGQGYRFRDWQMKNVNFDNVAKSLFFTGFSVPLMEGAYRLFIHLWPKGLPVLLSSVIGFFIVSFVNGLYISMHNILRGFDRRVVVINFFRPIIAWPLATLTGPALLSIGVPVSVISKFWSEVVGGIIEGSNRYRLLTRLYLRDITEIIPRFMAKNYAVQALAALDLLYIVDNYPRAKTSLVTYFTQKGEAVFPAYKLRQWYLSKANYEQLFSFMLAHYNKEQVLFLSNMVAGKSSGLLNYLKKLTDEKTEDRSSGS